MSKYYYNGNVIVTPFSVVTNQPIFSVDTVSLKHIRSQQSAQRWELQFNVLTNDNVAATLLGVIDEMSSTGLMPMPQLPEIDKLTTASGTISIPTQVEVENSAVGLNTSSASGTMPKGSFIKFSNHSKVYILKADLDLSGATATAQVYPKITNTVTAGETFLYNQDCEISYYRDINGMNGIRFLDGVLAEPGTVNLIEAI
jgi:hypothetical protein